MYGNIKICIVDDEDLLRITLEDELSEKGFQVVSFDNPLNALKFIENDIVHIVVSDIKMPEMNGIDLLKKIKKINNDIEVILMTAFGSVDSAVEAMKLGAYDYVAKPFKTAELMVKLNKLISVKELEDANKEFSDHFSSKYNLNSYLGKSAVVEEIKESIKIVADSDATVLVTGETGTGKELIANIIHYSSPRRKKPLIKVSCAILSKDIFESELFGHVKGAFTGAEKERIGRFEEANGGTIYLDDIDDVPLELQVKLLRVLQENEIEKLGTNKPIKVDVRVIASTKKNLRQLCDEGKFREDLYYRLNVFPIHLPPLRERREDIPILFKKFLELSSKRKLKVSPLVYNSLSKYNWPGNTRELKNLAERCCLLCKDGEINGEHLPAEIRFPTGTKESVEFNNTFSLPELISQVEVESIKNALETSGGNKNKAAELLGIPLSTLRSKMEKYNIS